MACRCFYKKISFSNILTSESPHHFWDSPRLASTFHLAMHALESRDSALRIAASILLKLFCNRIWHCHILWCSIPGIATFSRWRARKFRSASSTVRIFRSMASFRRWIASRLTPSLWIRASSSVRCFTDSNFSSFRYLDSIRISAHLSSHSCVKSLITSMTSISLPIHAAWSMNTAGSASPARHQVISAFDLDPRQKCVSFDLILYSGWRAVFWIQKRNAVLMSLV